MISFSHSGDFSQTERFLKRMRRNTLFSRLDARCRAGVVALEQATPKKTGKTASSWSYEIRKESNGPVVYWTNSNVRDGFNVAIYLQYGHGTGSGYVQGIDYINPALKPIFDKITEDLWWEVTKS